MFWFFGLEAWDLSSPTRDLTCTPCIGRRSLNHLTTREVPRDNNFKIPNFTQLTCINSYYMENNVLGADEYAKM